MCSASAGLKCPRCGSTLLVVNNEMTCQSCGIRLTLTPSASATTSSNNTERLIQQWHLQPYVYKDNYTGLDAFRMLIPQGWQVQGGIDWVFEHAAIPYRPGLFHSKNGLEGI